MKRHWRMCAVGSAAIAVAVVLWLRLGPLPAGLLDERPYTSTTVLDRDGRLLYEGRSNEGTRGARLSAEALPANLVSATLAAEDHRFYRHVGVDPLAILRACIHNARARRFVEGGSTITQQVAKLLLARKERADNGRPPGPRGLFAKVREAVIAIRLEHRFTKREILALYLNLAPYGNQIVGAERASRAYFGGAASLLTPAQAAFLAALPQRPSTFNPYRNHRAALARQRRIIDRMAELALLSRVARDEARAEHLTFGSGDTPFAAPHFVEMVLASFGKNPPVRVETTLDAELQHEVEGIIRSQRPNLERHRAHNVAVVVLHNASGEWLAWEGSGNYFDRDHGGAINGPVSPRQPGSALKPFTYALAFEEGRTPASVLPDVPTHFPTAEDGVVYSPRNYDGRFRGPLLARRALAGSENVPAVALTSELGVAKLVRFLRGAGFLTFDKTAAYYGLGITLGNSEVRLAELVAGYAAFARGGTWRTPVAIRAIDRGDGREPMGHDADEATSRLVSRRSAFWITDILSDPNAREYVFGRGGSLDFPFPVAVKTGTSQGYRDNWTIGYTKEVTVGVWVGNFDRSALTNSSGVTGAGPIFHAVMLAAQRRIGGDVLESRERLASAPNDVVRRRICTLSGMRANPWCPSQTNEWVPAEDQGLPCSWHHQSDEGLLVIWPPSYRQWAEERGLLDDPRHAKAVNGGGFLKEPRAPQRSPHRRTFEIVNPPQGAIYLIDPTLRREFQTLSLRVASDRDTGPIEWVIDGRVLGTSHADQPFFWSLVAGRHTIVARSQSDRVAESHILVK